MSTLDMSQQQEPEIVVEGCSITMDTSSSSKNNNNNNNNECKNLWVITPATTAATEMKNDSTSHTIINKNTTTATIGSVGEDSSSNINGKTGGGLSELSKQLRLLQHTNQSQTLEIEKLQRQLRILSELQNVNVNDIRMALNTACEAEAFGELQRRITVLQAELQTVVALSSLPSTLPPPVPTVDTTTTLTVTDQEQEKEAVNTDDDNNNKTMMMMMIPAAAEQEIKNAKSTIANLELRMGELEEIDEQHQEEIQTLYGQLQNQQMASLQIQFKCDELQTEKEQLQLELRQVRLEQQRRQEEHEKQREQQEQVSVVAVAATTTTTVDDDDHSSHNRGEIQELQRAHIAALATVRETETWANVVSEKLQLCEQQREATEKELTLRNSQYKARFMVQEENIEDLRQQLVSLYTAYEFIKEEKDRDDNNRDQLQALLGNADAEVARQVDEIDQSHRSLISSPPPQKSSSSMAMTKSPYDRDYNNNNSNSMIHIVPPESPLMDQQQRSPSASLLRKNSLADSTPLMSGDLLIKDTKGMRKKWRKRHARLYATISHFHLDVGEDKGYAIQIGISSIELYSKYPYGISIYMGSKSGISLIVAATNEHDFQDWMSILTYATTGTETIDDYRSTTPPTTSPSPSTTALNDYNYDHNDDDNFNSSTPVPRQNQERTLLEQQDSDLEFALELSEREFRLSSQRQVS